MAEEQRDTAETKVHEAENGGEVSSLPASVVVVMQVLQERFPGLAIEHKEDEWVEVKAAAEQVPDLAAFLRDEPRLQFNFLSSISAVDYQDEGFQVVYHLISLPEGRRKLVLKVAPAGDRNDPWVPSVVSIWPTADWHEREAWDLMGIRFEGHPDLRRILLREDWVGHPLRKDYRDERPVRERQIREDWIGRSGA